MLYPMENIDSHIALDGFLRMLHRLDIFPYSYDPWTWEHYISSHGSRSPQV